jgi:hypothetical protein
MTMMSLPLSVLMTVLWKMYTWYLLSVIWTFYLWSWQWYFHYQWSDSDFENYLSMWRQPHYDVINKNNNAHNDFVMALCSNDCLMKNVTVLICSGVDGLSIFVNFSSWFNSRKFEYIFWKYWYKMFRLFVFLLYKFLKQNENEMEYYLSHPDRNVRLILAKFWLSDHQFLIEIGRYLCSGVDGLSILVNFSSWFNSRKFEYIFWKYWYKMFRLFVFLLHSEEKWNSSSKTLQITYSLWSLGILRYRSSWYCIFFM